MFLLFTTKYKIKTKRKKKKKKKEIKFHFFTSEKNERETRSQSKDSVASKRRRQSRTRFFGSQSEEAFFFFFLLAQLPLYFLDRLENIDTNFPKYPLNFQLITKRAPSRLLNVFSPFLFFIFRMDNNTHLLLFILPTSLDYS